MRLNLIRFAAMAIITLLSFGTAHASTLNDVKAAGHLKCGINTGLPGFAFTDDKGNWKGFDVAFCRALAAAVLGNADKVKYVNLTGKTRFPALASGEIDVLSRNTTWTFSRDVDLGFTFLGVSYYDGQGFIGRKSLGIKSAKELDGASVCIQTGTTTELNLADFFRSNKMKYEPVPIETNAEARAGYLAERCDVYTTDASGLAATKSTFKDAENHMVFPEIISKEPLGPVVRQGDDQWADIARWTLNALIVAEELGVTQANVNEKAKGTKNPEINRMLGKEGSMGKMLGLDATWAVRAIAAGGNYAEIFEKYLGTKTPLGLSRGLNALYKDGGILYAPPIR
ncbi:MAG: amino acid ABC transporter substrate-binding protein [Alphaproteobacteria bacterium]|nr:amino acid ABC transporter substrate-binding protein [Alphaproteobacteria bacterium]PPR14499.1 MAG: putative amino-acid ABC transporter-binding protein YhdW [Alphaproteobacteria bacterium MarineAlpha12_Bin1]|tara:strand:- start:7831 stop:8853 length:1023 start_codon:yes stop_codon:yes gene_type:complete